MRRLQWILILVLGVSTVMLALHGRRSAALAAAERENAIAEAMNARAMLAELQQRDPPQQVEQIVVGIGDKLHVRSDLLGIGEQTAEVQIDGQALFTEIGWVAVAGKSRPEIEDVLTARYSQIYESRGPVYVIVESRR